jgi:SSS family solute:Na+ symporter
MKDSLTGFLYQYADLNFLHFAFLLFLVCTLVLVMVSYFTSQPSSQKVDGLTIHTTIKELEVRDKSWKRRDFILSVLLIILVGIIWLYFSG